MKITADTNLLVRAIVIDNAAQSRAAQAELDGAELVALTLPALCELVWVLSRFYKFANDEIATALRRLLEARNIAADHPTIEAGLRMLDDGGDFADGVIADAGKWLGAETFVSFDRQAVKRLRAQGETARAPK